MKRSWFTLAAAAAAAAALLCLPTVAAADTTVKADLVELNDSGASGTVVLTTTDDGGLKVSIRSKGLVPGQPHPQHIHGSAGGHHFMCPTVKDNDQDGDGILTNEEASGEYGTIFMALTTRGGATPQDGLDVARMPVADKQGRLREIPGRVPSLSGPWESCAFADRCPRADDRTRSEVPLLREVRERHRVACFHPGAEWNGR
jgi:oligopeptide/dipeptide ABC transporter ATP-binding protein